MNTLHLLLCSQMVGYWMRVINPRIRVAGNNYLLIFRSCMIRLKLIPYTFQAPLFLVAVHPSSTLKLLSTQKPNITTWTGMLCWQALKVLFHSPHSVKQIAWLGIFIAQTNLIGPLNLLSSDKLFSKSPIVGPFCVLRCVYTRQTSASGIILCYMFKIRRRRRERRMSKTCRVEWLGSIWSMNVAYLADGQKCDDVSQQNEFDLRSKLHVE